MPQVKSWVQNRLKGSVPPKPVLPKPAPVTNPAPVTQTPAPVPKPAPVTNPAPATQTPAAKPPGWFARHPIAAQAALFGGLSAIGPVASWLSGGGDAGAGAPPPGPNQNININYPGQGQGGAGGGAEYAQGLGGQGSANLGTGPLNVAGQQSQEALVRQNEETASAINTRAGSTRVA